MHPEYSAAGIGVVAVGFVAIDQHHIILPCGVYGTLGLEGDAALQDYLQKVTVKILPHQIVARLVYIAAGIAQVQKSFPGTGAGTVTVDIGAWGYMRLAAKHINPSCVLYGSRIQDFCRVCNNDM
jgi:hypothetical protein